MSKGEKQEIGGALSIRHDCDAISLLLLQVSVVESMPHVTLRRGGATKLMVSAATRPSASVTVISRMWTPGSKLTTETSKESVPVE